MKRALLLPLLILALAACEPKLDDGSSLALVTKAGSRATNCSVCVYTDPSTGCEYLTLYQSGLTPRLYAYRQTDGTLTSRQVGCRAPS